MLDWLWRQIVKALIWLFDTLLTPFRWLLDGILWIIGQALYLIFDGLLTVIQLFFGAIDFSAVWFINQLGIPQCFTLIGLAIGIRMLLNLLPAAVTRI